MKNWLALGTSWVALLVGAAFSCSSPRDYREDNGNAGESSQAGAPIHTVGGSVSEAGNRSVAGGENGATAGAGGASAGGTAGSVGVAGASGGGTDGSLGGAGGVANGDGGAGSPEEACPKNSCCLASSVVARDVVDPTNACQSCQPHRTTSDWSDLNGELCKTAVAATFSPSKVQHLSKFCGEGGCSDITASEPDVEQMLVITPTTEVDSLRLDFSNLRASASIGLTKAVLRFTVKAAGPAQTFRVTAPGVAQAVCSWSISSNAYVEVKCDASLVVKEWMKQPASAERTLTIATVSNGNPLIVQSHKATSAAQRPVLLVDYTASCEGDQCVNIAR